MQNAKFEIEANGDAQPKKFVEILDIIKLFVI